MPGEYCPTPQSPVAERTEPQRSLVAQRGSRLILADADILALQSNPVIEIEKLETEAEFRALIQEVTEPYSHIFDSHIPPFSKGSDRHPLTRRPLKNGRGYAAWEQTQLIGDTKYSQSYTLFYIQKKPENSIRSLDMKIKTPENKQLSYGQIPELRLDFDGGQIDKASFGWSPEGLSSVRPGLEDTQVITYLDRYFPAGPDSRPEKISEIEFNFKNTSLTLKYPSAYKNRDIEVSYIFDGSGNAPKFRQYIEQKRAFAEHVEPSVKLPAFLGPHVYITLLQSLLSLIPTLNLDDLGRA